MISKGDFVKIEDVGILALCVDTTDEECELDLDGEIFWLPMRCCSVPFRGDTDAA